MTGEVRALGERRRHSHLMSLMLAGLSMELTCAHGKHLGPGLRLSGPNFPVHLLAP